MKYDELTDMDCKIATLSVDPVKSHNEWLRDVVAHCENEIEVKFPIIGMYYSLLCGSILFSLLVPPTVLL